MKFNIQGKISGQSNRCYSDVEPFGLSKDCER